MKRSIFFTLLALLPFLANATKNPEPPTGKKQGSADALPYLKFVQNKGQWEGPAVFRSDMHGGRLWLRKTGYTFDLQDMDKLEAIHEKYYHHPSYAPGERIEDEIVDMFAIHVDFLGANPEPKFSTEEGSEPVYNYFLGSNPQNWATNMRAWKKVKYEGIYPGIDLHFYSKGADYKYDFVVAPGADPSRIALEYKGAMDMVLGKEYLSIQTKFGPIREMMPYTYQLIDGKEVEVPSEFRLNGKVLKFVFPKGYRTDLPLLIDPTLVAATYSGSLSTCYGHTATYDDQGNIFAGGICFGNQFPTTAGAYQMTYGGATDMGINKYDPTATTLMYSTYIGGTSADYPHSMIANSQGELCVLGSTNSSDFPLTVGAFDNIYGGTSEIAVCHLSTNGNAMIGSTFLGGSSMDGRNSGGTNFNYGDTYRGEVMVDGADNIYIASITQSNDFPVTAGVFQGTFGGGTDGVIAKMNPTLTTLIWSSYIGGAGDEVANSIKLNGAGELFVAGGTDGATGIPTTPGAYQTLSQGSTDGYLLHINPSATTILEGTYLGTSGDDQAYFVELDASGFPYVLGQSPNYPVSSGVYSQAGGTLFAQKLNANLSASIWSTVLGGNGADLSPTAFLVDICGNIYAAGWGNTAALPVTPNAYQPVGGSDFYLVVLEPNASALLYATNFGGSGWEHVDGGTSRFDRLGVVYEASCSNSTNWPTTPGAVFPSSTNNSWDVVCFKFDFNFVGIAASFASANAPSGCAPFPVNFVNNSSNTPTTLYYWDFGTGDTDTVRNPTYTYTQAGTYTVTLIVTDTAACAGSDTATLSVVITALPPLNLDQDTTFCYGDSIQLHAPVIPGATYQWTPSAGLSNPTISNPMAEPSVSTSYLLTVTDPQGCQSEGTVDVGVVVVTADAGNLSSFCEGEGGTQLVAGQPTGGTSPYYYTWWCDQNLTPFCGLDSIYDNDPIANPSASTWYYLQVSDYDGCLSEIDSVWVQILPKPIVDAGPDVAICQPPAPGALISATVLNAQDAPGPYTIQWLPSAGLNDHTIFTPFARPDSTTIFTAVVVSSNGCTSEYTTTDTLSSVTVTVHPQPIADAGPDIHTCLGDTMVIQGLGYGAGPQYDYEWSPLNGLSNPTIANPRAAPAFTHEYILTVWSNGCPSIGDTMTYWVHTLPTPSAGPIREICLGESVQLDAFGAGDSSAFYTYVWTPSATLDDPTAENPFANPDTTTVYDLIVTSSWGCESELAQVQVTVIPSPQAEAGPNLTLCEGDSIQLQGGYYYTTTGPAPPSEIYYSWWPGGTLNDTTLATPWAYPVQSNIYYLDVRHNGCESRDSMILTVIPTNLPDALADTNVACEGVPVQLHASGGIGNAIYQWTPAAGLDDAQSQNPIATPDSTTTYVLLMTEGGCVTKAELTLEVIPSPDVTFSNSITEGCSPFPVSFLSSSENLIQHIWNFGDGEISNEFAPTHIYEQPGTYQVSLTGVNTGGCEETVSTTIVSIQAPILTDFSMAPEGNPSMTGSPLELLLPQGGVLFQDQSIGQASSWLWDFGDGIRSTEVQPTHNYAQPGMYYVTLMTTNAAGCSSTKIHGPIVIKAPDLFIPNVFSPNADGLNDVFLVEYTGSQAFKMEIYDRWGELLHSTRNKQAAWKGDNMKGFPVPEGVFFYNVTVGDKSYNGPVTLVR